MKNCFQYQCISLNRESHFSDAEDDTVTSGNFAE